MTTYDGLHFALEKNIFDSVVAADVAVVAMVVVVVRLAIARALDCMVRCEKENVLCGHERIHGQPYIHIY